MPIAEGYVVTILVVLCSLAGLLFALLYAFHTAAIRLDDETSMSRLLVQDEQNADNRQVLQKVRDISKAISEGANAFLYREYVVLGYFMIIFSLVIFLLIGGISNWIDGIFTTIAFNVGAATSILCGFIGMRIAVFANSRTCVGAARGWGPAFVTAFKAGCVMGFALVSIGVLVLYIMVNFFRLYYTEIYDDMEISSRMYESVAGYGLGGSSIALFGRVGGGIYTKAADVGADLCGKLELNIPEDDPRNPAVIADNVGDNVGDIAGMGADLFGSFAESSCACMVIAAQSPQLHQEWASLCFPMVVISVGIVVCILTSFVATNLMVVSSQREIEPSLKRQLMVSTIIMTPLVFLLTAYFLPAEFDFAQIQNVKDWQVGCCIVAGLWSGLIIGYTTEYYTSKEYTPVQEVSQACKTGAATNIIYGLALGYKSVIIPIICIAVTIYIGFSLAYMYGIACAAIGILSTMSIGLTIDAYGPICDNAGGIAEMAGMGPEVREKTDALDAAGNTTAAIGKGFAIGSAAFVSLALFGGFVTIVNLPAVDILGAFEFAGLLIGAMLPYWFTAMTMKAVGIAAQDMVMEVRRQLTENPKIMEGTALPDYARCVDISTQASLRRMIAPGLLVILSPLLVGYIFGVKALAGLLAGALVSGVQIAISASNSGGGWDNAKKYIEGGGGDLGGKGSPAHKAAVVGDTVGDPLKDTSGPSLNILIKLMAIISLVFARSFPKVDKGGYLEQLFHV